MRIPFQRATEGMKNTDETWDKVFGFIDVMKHTEDNTADSLKKAVKERAILKKEMAKIFINGKNAMPMCTVYQLKGHRGRTFLAVFNTAGRTKTAFTAERDKLHISAMRAQIHGAPKGRVAAVNHLVNVFNDDLTRMKCI